MQNKYALNLRRLRLRLKLTQKEMAEKIGVKRGTYASYESKIEPSIELLELISRKFEVKIEELLKENIVTAKVFGKTEREAARIYIDTQIELRVLTMLGMLEEVGVVNTLPMDKHVLHDDGPEQSLESLQYQVEYLLSKVAKLTIELKAKDSHIATLQAAVEDKQKIIDLLSEKK